MDTLHVVLVLLYSECDLECIFTAISTVFSTVQSTLRKLATGRS